jgi:hypothetical protein
VATVKMRVVGRGRTVVTAGPAGGPYGISIVGVFGDVEPTQISFGDARLSLGTEVPSPTKPSSRMRK